MMGDFKMELSALIHCRTYQFDFNPEFLAKPIDFSSDDVRWAREYILTATSYCDELEGQRNIVFNNSKFVVFGIVCLLDVALKKHHFSEEEIKRFSFDENGRKIKCFFGFVLHIKNKKYGDIPDLSDDDYADLLRTYIANEEIFFDKKQPEIKINYFKNVDITRRSMQNCMPQYDISSRDRDDEYYQFALSNVSPQHEMINLCTNVYNIKMLLDGNYTLFTTNHNTIQRYQQKLRDDEEREKTKIVEESIENENVKKKDVLKVVFAVGVLILAVLIILAILL